MKSLLIFLFIYSIGFEVLGQTENKETLAFVGEKIAVSVKQPASVRLETTDMTTNDGDTIAILHRRNYAFSFDYKVVKLVYGNYSYDTITFTAYSEFKNPDFAKYEFILFMLEKSKSGDFVLLSPYVFDVYKTRNGKWASDYAVPQWSRDNFAVKPEKISFKKTVSFDISNVDDEYIKKHFPSPYYKIKEDRAIPLYGIYVEDLFKFIKKEKL